MEHKLNTTNNYNLKKNEKFIIRECLNSTHGNVAKASEKLGLTRTTLYRKLKDHRISLKKIRNQAKRNRLQ